MKTIQELVSFNTASGKYYCNNGNPGCVSTGAGDCFNTASGKYYCNSRPYKASIHGA